MRGYKCENKSAFEILETLGFDPNEANRGWVLNRIGKRKGNETPIRMHALIQTDIAGNEYIDIHADIAGPNNTHITIRGARTKRWYELFAQIDNNEMCDAGPKIMSNYLGLRDAVESYNESVAV